MTALDTVHRDYHRSEVWLRTTWMGVPIAKLPLDAWVLQEIVVETEPEYIVETGSYYGGSALFLAHILDLIGNGRVISIDVNPYPRPNHNRIDWLTGDSVNGDALDWIRQRVHGKRTMVILDSDHRKRHVAAELEAYAPLVSDGCYLVVEDTNMGGRPVEWDQGAGPAAAVAEFLKTNPDFEPDPEREKHLLTFAPGGWLKRQTKE